MAKYECVRCGRVFESNEFLVTCPGCGSSNVKVYRKQSLVLPIVLALAALLVAGICLGLFFTKHDTEPVEEEEIYSPIDTTVVLSQNTIPELSGTPAPVAKGNTYSMDVNASVESGDNLRYELYLPGSSTPAYTSDNGKFEKIAASTDPDGIYNLSIINESTSEKIDLPVSGFAPIVNKVVKIEKDELQKIFNSGNVPADMKSKFAAGYTIKAKGLEAGEPAPDRYSEIFNRIGSAWESVEVESVSYDQQDRITSFTIKVTE